MNGTDLYACRSTCVMTVPLIGRHFKCAQHSSIEARTDRCMQSDHGNVDCTPD